MSLAFFFLYMLYQMHISYEDFFPRYLRSTYFKEGVLSQLLYIRGIINRIIIECKRY